VVKTKILHWLLISGALFLGLVFIDVDHVIGYPVFHWMGSVMFFVFFGVGLVVRKFYNREEKA